MALEKTVTSSHGVSANYHRIDFMNFLIDDDCLRFHVLLYKDSAARTAGNDHLGATEYECSGADFTTYFAPAVLDVLNQNPQERAYEWLKTQSSPVDFTTGTTDV